jgi:RNA polymerase sigma factor for flagellar operon FliA
MDELRRQDWAPRSLRRLGRRIDRTQEALYSKNGQAPTEEEIAVELEISAADVRRAREELEQADVVSLNAKARAADEGLALEVGDTVEAAPGDGDPERTALVRERAARMRKGVVSLSTREREVLTLVHGHELSGAEVGAVLGVTESRVSQIMNGVRTKLRANLDEYDVDSAA